jgi:hypothetical protein
VEYGVGQGVLLSKRDNGSKNAVLYSPIVGLTDIWALFIWTNRCSILYVCTVAGLETETQ